MELGKWKVLLFNRKRKNERLQDWLLAPVLFGDRATPHTWKPISFIPLFFVFVFMFAFAFVLFTMYWSKNDIKFIYLWNRVFLGGVLPCFTLNFPTWFPPPHLMPNPTPTIPFLPSTHQQYLVEENGKGGKRDFGSICFLLFAASVNKQPPPSQEVFLHQFLHSPANCRSADGQHSKRNASTIKTIKKTFEFSEHKEGR